MKLKLSIAGLLAIILLLVIPFGVIAQTASTTTPSPTPIINEVNMSAEYPKIMIPDSGTAQFEVSLTYVNTDFANAKAAVFDLSVSGPKDWTTKITPDYPQDKSIASIQLDPWAYTPFKIEVNVTPPAYTMVAPGEYNFTLAANSGTVKGTLALTVVVTPTYNLQLTTSNSSYSVKPGHDNYFLFTLANYGSTAVGPINFSGEAPDGWQITYTDSGVDTLGSNMQQSFNADVKPPTNAPAGDYHITLKASAKETNAPDLPLTVRISGTDWSQWLGIGVVVVLLGAVSFLFLKTRR